MTFKINAKYLAYVFLAVLLSCFFHEFAHWLAGELLGNPMKMSFNGANPISGTYVHEWNRNIITIAGPIFTLLQGIVFFFIFKKRENVNLYPFLFFPFVYRFFAGLANILGPNDEGRFGLSYGLGLYTVSIVFCSILLFLIIRYSIKHKITFKFNLITFVVCAFSLLLIVFVDQYFKITLIG